MITNIIIFLIILQPITCAYRFRYRKRPTKSENPIPRSCKGIVEEIERLDNEHEVRLVCEQNNGARAILSVTKDWIKKKYGDGKFQSGRDVIDIPTGSENIDGVITNPIGTDFVLRRDTNCNERRKLVETTGKKTVLVVRVVALDESTTNSMDEISDNVFGSGLTHNDVVNLRSQYLLCSHGKLEFIKAAERNAVSSLSANIMNGVTEGGILKYSEFL